MLKISTHSRFQQSGSNYALKLSPILWHAIEIPLVFQLHNFCCPFGQIKQMCLCFSELCDELNKSEKLGEDQEGPKKRMRGKIYID